MTKVLKRECIHSSPKRALWRASTSPDAQAHHQDTADKQCPDGAHTRSWPSIAVKREWQALVLTWHGKHTCLDINAGCLVGIHGPNRPWHLRELAGHIRL